MRAHVPERANADVFRFALHPVHPVQGWGGSPPSPPGPPGPGVVAVSDNKVMVRFVEDYDPAFTGVDLRVYGPFEEGDILRMPKANAEVLESRGIVRWFGGNPDN